MFFTERQRQRERERENKRQDVIHVNNSKFLSHIHVPIYLLIHQRCASKSLCFTSISICPLSGPLNSFICPFDHIASFPHTSVWMLAGVQSSLSFHLWNGRCLILFLFWQMDIIDLSGFLYLSNQTLMYHSCLFSLSPAALLCIIDETKKLKLCPSISFPATIHIILLAPYSSVLSLSLPKKPVIRDPAARHWGECLSAFS